MRKELRAYIECELRGYHQTKQDLLGLRLNPLRLGSNVCLVDIMITR